MLNRREFLRLTVAGGAVLAAPRLGWGDEPQPQGARTLVLLHLRGGNPGLTTVVPVGDPRYRVLRPTIGIAAGTTLKVGDGLGLHPGLAGFKALWDRKRLAIANGVGYPKPNYSHFRATEIWYTAQPQAAPVSGWLGRMFAKRERETPLRAVALAKEPPLTMAGDDPRVATLTDFRSFQLPGGLSGVAELYAKLGDRGGALGDVGRSGAEALKVADKIASLTPAGGNYTGRLGARLRQVMALLRADLPLEVIQLDQGGYDTHANQLGNHNRLMTELGNNLNLFQQQLEQSGLGNKVVTVVFSEFGRRAAENASGGTDHGSAGPVFVMGQGVKQALHGDYPSLTDLARGNLKFTLDFRRIYAGLLRDAFQQDPAAILGEGFKPLELFA